MSRNLTILFQQTAPVTYSASSTVNPTRTHTTSQQGKYQTRSQVRHNFLSAKQPPRARRMGEGSRTLTYRTPHRLRQVPRLRAAVFHGRIKLLVGYTNLHEYLIDLTAFISLRKGSWLLHHTRMRRLTYDVLARTTLSSCKCRRRAER
jgi:hypothetical protein